MSETMKIIFATNNQGKYKEIKEIMKDFGVEILSMKEAGIYLEPEETGSTFLENATIKAKAVFAEAPADSLVIADDSGLLIDYLDGEPGVDSALYLGVNTSYRIKNQSLIDRLDGVPTPKRTARFVCVMVAILPDGTLLSSEGVMEGLIGYEERGENGFGYDPIFYVPDFFKHSAELTPEEKNEISHRGKALRKMKEILEKYI
ncbi:MAG: RdgB/HAM1 family non-canonical purine NTP pyrophosphatase [Lachnospiraceae bacterium]|nr:RdgB/HAM1 family non-canonical purine NTP pyrophosphatase [Lachnospiraceae bacterium]